MKNNIFMGIDTSNYTTSIAFVDEKGRVLSEHRELLKVPVGQRGLRQSDAFYQHCFNLPLLLESSKIEINFNDVTCVGVSTKPRNVEGSYMPVFKCGENFANFAATMMNVPVYNFSHQEGHIKAITAFNQVGDKFITFHLSGGTNEILKINNDTNFGSPMEISIEGKTLDISMGQLIDRVGVALELPFPAGPYMDKLALNFKENMQNFGIKEKLHIKSISLKGLDVNISGIETQITRNIKDFFKEEIAYVLFKKIVACLEKQVAICKEQYPDFPIVFAGGVSKSQFLREHLKDQVVFGQYSSDNAVGIALLAKEKFLSDKSVLKSNLS